MSGCWSNPLLLNLPTNRVGQNHTYTVYLGVYSVFLAGKLIVWPYTVYIYIRFWRTLPIYHTVVTMVTMGGDLQPYIILVCSYKASGRNSTFMLSCHIKATCPTETYRLRQTYRHGQTYRHRQTYRHGQTYNGYNGYNGGWPSAR